MLTFAVALLASSPVYADGRDDRTLFKQKLINRQLPEQLDAQPHRIGGDLGMLSAAGDVLLSTQLTLDGSPQALFHGFFYADTYVAVRLFEYVDVNLNVVMLNQTASGGYRVLSDVLPGVAVHLNLPIGMLGGEEVRLHALTNDLDLVTIGQGVLVEGLPLEGVMGGFTWNGLALTGLFGGRVFWQSDDFVNVTFTAFEGRLGAGYTNWRNQSTVPEGTPFRPAAPDAHYAAIFGRVELFDGLDVSGEYTARLGGELSSAALGRADYTLRAKRFAVHAGYQFRFYQRGFGPADVLCSPTTIFATPAREDHYVTNSFEFLGLAPLYDQWSHTMMLEARGRIGMFEAFAESEVWIRTIDDAVSPARPIQTSYGRGPGTSVHLFYRAGARLYPIADFPGRIVAFVSNKAVRSLPDVTAEIEQRFYHAPSVFFEAEVSL